MNLNFTKMHGLGNDYIYFDCMQENLILDPSSVAQKLSDRHFSIGGDGIVLILPHEDADCQMRMFNADGSEAEMCGNAIRCVGKFVYDKGYCPKDTIQIMTGNGILSLAMTIENGIAVAARVDMGEPILNGPDIPIAVNTNPVQSHTIEVAGESFSFTGVSMGNPHAVFFVDEITDRQVLELGPQIEVNTLFPNRINVEFATVKSASTIDMRVWERGSGETMACGTGACAVGVAAMLNNLTDDKVVVHLLGGDLIIEWEKETNHVFMTGPASYAFTGTVEI